jgi:hypothetical protein
MGIRESDKSENRSKMVVVRLKIEEDAGSSSKVAIF